MSKFLILFVVSCICHNVYSSNTEEVLKKLDIMEQELNKKLEPSFQKIQTSYDESVKASFQRACYNCHSTKTEYPLYYYIPFIKQMIDEDITKGRAAMLLDSQFPFKGEGTPNSKLMLLQVSIEEGQMPPKNYLRMHSEATLTEKEKEAVMNWINNSLMELAPFNLEFLKIMRLREDIKEFSSNSNGQ